MLWSLSSPGIFWRKSDTLSEIFLPYSLPQRLEGNKSPVFVDISGCVAAVAHRNFYSEVEHSNLCQIVFVFIDIDFVLINMTP